MSTLLRPAIRRTRAPLSRRGGVLQGCLIALGVVVVILIGIGIFVALSWKGWVASGIKAAAAEAVQKSQLPADQQARITTRINKLADDFENGAVTVEQLTKVGEEILKSPLLPLGSVMVAEEQYLKPSSLPPEEKDAGRRALERVARGVFEKKISEDGLKQVLDPIVLKSPGGDTDLKKTLTTEELKQFLAGAKAKADEAGVPDEPFTVNIADELEKAIDKALGVPTAGGG